MIARSRLTNVFQGSAKSKRVEYHIKIWCYNYSIHVGISITNKVYEIKHHALKH